MAISHDTATRSSTTFHNADFNWDHTANASAKGAVVIVFQEGSSDLIAGVTYGSTAMQRIEFQERTAAQAETVYIYFLGDLTGIGGTQNVAVDMTGTQDTVAMCATVLADSATTTADSHNGSTGSAANPQITVTFTGTLADWQGYYGLMSGIAAPVTTVSNSCLHLFGNDLGQSSAMFAHKVGASASSTTMGYTAASDAFAQAGIIVAEVAEDPNADPITAAVTAAALNASVKIDTAAEVSAATLSTASTGAISGKPSAADISATANDISGRHSTTVEVATVAAASNSTTSEVDVSGGLVSVVGVAGDATISIGGSEDPTAEPSAAVVSVTTDSKVQVIAWAEYP